MKKHIIIATILVAGTSLTQAASSIQNLTWSGGTETFSTSEASSAEKWSGTTPKLNSSEDPIAYNFSTGGSIKIGSTSDPWTGMYTSDGGSWTVSNNTNVTIFGKNQYTWTGNITVGAGSFLTINNSSLQLKDGSYKIEGAFLCGWDIKFDSGCAATQDFSLGSSGIVMTSSRLYTPGNGKTIQFSGTVDLGTGTNYVLKQRLLFSGESRINGDDTSLDTIKGYFNNKITAKFDGLSTYDLSIAEKSVFTDSDLGKYFLSTDITGSIITLNYIQAIPEPSMFGLLTGMGALALVCSRRRRK